jgi:hypothetical protein
MELSGQLYAPVVLSHAKELSVPIGQKADGPRVGLEDVEKRKMLPHPDSNLGPSVIQPVVSAYADCIIPDK